MDENKFVNSDNRIRIIAKMTSAPVPFDKGRQVFYIKSNAPDHENNTIPVVLYNNEVKFISHIKVGDKVAVYGRIDTQTILRENGSHQTRMFVRLENCFLVSELPPIIKSNLIQDDVGILVGEIIKTPQDVTIPDGRKLKRFILKVNKNDGTDKYNTIPLSLYGRVADSCSKLISCGQRVGVKCHLNNISKVGSPETHLVCNAFFIQAEHEIKNNPHFYDIDYKSNPEKNSPIW